MARTNQIITNTKKKTKTSKIKVLKNIDQELLNQENAVRGNSYSRDELREILKELGHPHTKTKPEALMIIVEELEKHGLLDDDFELEIDLNASKRKKAPKRSYRSKLKNIALSDDDLNDDEDETDETEYDDSEESNVIVVSKRKSANTRRGSPSKTRGMSRRRNVKDTSDVEEQTIKSRGNMSPRTRQSNLQVRLIPALSDSEEDKSPSTVSKTTASRRSSMVRGSSRLNTSKNDVASTVNKSRVNRTRMGSNNNKINRTRTNNKTPESRKTRRSPKSTLRSGRDNNMQTSNRLSRASDSNRIRGLGTRKPNTVMSSRVGNKRSPTRLSSRMSVRKSSDATSEKVIDALLEIDQDKLNSGISYGGDDTYKLTELKKIVRGLGVPPSNKNKSELIEIIISMLEKNNLLNDDIDFNDINIDDIDIDDIEEPSNTLPPVIKKSSIRRRSSLRKKAKNASLSSRPTLSPGSDDEDMIQRTRNRKGNKGSRRSQVKISNVRNRQRPTKGNGVGNNTTVLENILDDDEIIQNKGSRRSRVRNTSNVRTKSPVNADEFFNDDIFLDNTSNNVSRNGDSRRAMGGGGSSTKYSNITSTNSNNIGNNDIVNRSKNNTNNVRTRDRRSPKSSNPVRRNSNASNNLSKTSKSPRSHTRQRTNKQTESLLEGIEDISSSTSQNGVTFSDTNDIIDSDNNVNIISSDDSNDNKPKVKTRRGKRKSSKVQYDDIISKDKVLKLPQELASLDPDSEESYFVISDDVFYKHLNDISLLKNISDIKLQKIITKLGYLTGNDNYKTIRTRNKMLRVLYNHVIDNDDENIKNQNHEPQYLDVYSMKELCKQFETDDIGYLRLLFSPKKSWNRYTWWSDLKTWFNDPLISTWDVEDCTNFIRMFKDFVELNQDLKSWELSNKSNVFEMFNGAVKMNKNNYPRGYKARKHMLKIDENLVSSVNASKNKNVYTLEELRKILVNAKQSKEGSKKMLVKKVRLLLPEYTHISDIL